MGLSELVYCPLLEEGEDRKLVGWSKITIDFAIKNKARIQKSIRGMIKNVNYQLNYYDIDDIYQNTMQYLYNSCDYDIDEAYERASNKDSPVTVEGYVFTCVKYCVKRYLTEKNKIEEHTIHDRHRDAEGKEASILDTLKDNKAEQAFSRASYSLEEICKDNEYKRYRFGIDMFLILYIRLRLQMVHKEDKFQRILTILGISNKDMQIMADGMQKDKLALEIAKAITRTSLSDAIRIIGDYTYSVTKINKLIELT